MSRIYNILWNTPCTTEAKNAVWFIHDESDNITHYNCHLKFPNFPFLSQTNALTVHSHNQC